MSEYITAISFIAATVITGLKASICTGLGLWCLSGPLPAMSDAEADKLSKLPWTWVMPLQPYEGRSNCGPAIDCRRTQWTSCGVFGDAIIEDEWTNILAPGFRLVSYPDHRTLGGTMCPIGVVFHERIARR